MDRKNDGMGSLSVATRRVTTENAPLPGFCETRKDAPGVLAVPQQGREAKKFRKSCGKIRKKHHILLKKRVFGDILVDCNIA